MFMRKVFFYLCLFCSSLLSAQIIYLNGPSSVGKTTLAKAIQESFDEPYFHIGFDTIYQMMPSKVNAIGRFREVGYSSTRYCDGEGRSHLLLQTGPLAERMPELLRELVRTMSQCGYNLIIDNVAVDSDSFENWKRALSDLDVLWVGLMAPLDVLEKRERERPDGLVGEARALYDTVHAGYSYDLFLDTSQLTVDEMVRQIRMKCGLN